MKPKSKSARKTLLKKIGSKLPKILKPKTPAPLVPRPVSRHETVSVFLRIWAGMRSIELPPAEVSCDSLMSMIIAASEKKSRVVEKVCCKDCGIEAPFLTILKMQANEPHTCLRCQGVEDMRARIQARILPLKQDVWSDQVNGQRSL